MQTKDLVILSDFNLFYGTAAGVSRMNNYSKAITKGGKVNVYLVSSVNFRLDEEMIQCGNGTYTSTEKKNILPTKGFTQLKDNFLFAYRVNKWRKKLNHDTVFLVYPSVDSSFEFFLLFFLKFLSSQKLFIEINEVRKSACFVNISSFSSVLRWLLNKFKYTITEYCWSFYNGLICISSNIESYARRYNKNTIIIPILSDFDDSEFVYNSPKEVFEILFTGCVYLKKENLKEFLYALVALNEKHSQWTFNLCGPTYPEDKKMLHDFLEFHKIDSKVHYLGELPHEEVIKMQRKASLLILPRDNQKQSYYGFSTKLSEYAISGIPILMTNTGVVSSFFKDDFNCYMVDGYNRQNFYDKLLIAISANESERKRIAMNAHNTALTSFAYFRYSEVLTAFLSLDNEDSVCN